MDWSKEEYYIRAQDDEAITELANNRVKIIACLGLGAPVEKYGDARFKTEEEIQCYLNYVRFIVRHFKDRIQYYEIWNEPNAGVPGWRIDLADYINLVKRAVPVIRQEYLEAKIMVGGTGNLREAESHDYLFSILRSDIMPLVDAISWHPMYGTSPEYDYYREYYYNYPSLVQEIKDVASAHGFEGEYIADELNWRTLLTPNPDEPWTCSEAVAAKYYARGIVMHLSMNVIADIIGWNVNLVEYAVQNLCTIMAGAEPVELPIEIQSEATNIKGYSFSLPNGDTLIALWTDGVAVDEDPGVKASLTFPGFTAQDAMGIDVLNGFQQPIITSTENGNLTIQNLLVRDYPLILHIAKSSQ